MWRQHKVRCLQWEGHIQLCPESITYANLCLFLYILLILAEELDVAASQVLCDKNGSNK